VGVTSLPAFPSPHTESLRKTAVKGSAVTADGFFVVEDSNGNTLYTRAGNFQVSKEGYLETDTGQFVQGWTKIDPATGTVSTNGSPANIEVPVGAAQRATATTIYSAGLNLNSAAKADATSAFTTPITVYDSLGGSHVLTLNFQKTGANQWSYDVTIPGDDVSGGTAGTPFDTGASGTLTFDSNGNLTDPAVGSPITVNITGLSDGAADMNLTWNLYSSSGKADITQFAQPSSNGTTAQNGEAAAQLVHVGLADGGQILAQYSNGDQVVVGQLALASIRNPETLIARGNNNFQLSARTANPVVGVPGTSGRGTVVGGSIEASTVDIATEFTNLIVYQRGYEANSKVVNTADQLSQDTINLIR
jgi:flagellar hook protein FlgE